MGPSCRECLVRRARPDRLPHTLARVRQADQRPLDSLIITRERSAPFTQAAPT